MQGGGTSSLQVTIVKLGWLLSGESLHPLHRGTSEEG